jgi:phage gpG-like protein
MAVDFKLDSATLDKLAKFVEKDCYVKVGVLNNEKREGGFGAVELAAVHEFGSVRRNIPKRSFLVKTMINRKDEFEREMKKNLSKLKELIASDGPEVVLGKIGSRWVGYVLLTFQAEGPGWAPLSPKTIARKGSDAILIDTGAMRRSITHEVVTE